MVKATPIAQPFTGSGYESPVSKITRDDILKFHFTWIKPNNATLVVVGDIEVKNLVSKVEKHFHRGSLEFLRKI
ncbi:MAG: insulinase family protein [Flammeovirgaceae bacterium]|nr:insulinase family protein [Flammeovirgaceae bacterium]